MNLQNYIAKRVRQLRINQGLTQEELEEKAGLPQKYAYKIERLQTNLTVRTLEKLLEALDTDIETFFSFENIGKDEEVAIFIDRIHELGEERQKRILRLFHKLLDEIQ